MEFEWDEDNVEHIAEHDITPEEVEELFDGNYAVERAKTVLGERRWVAYGMTAAERFLTVLFTKRKGRRRPITAYDSTPKNRRKYAPRIK